MTAWGWWLIVLGVIVGGFGLFFDMVGYAEVNNIGLIADRIVVVLFGGIIFLAGVMLLAAGAIQHTIRHPQGDPMTDQPAPASEAKPGCTVNAKN